ncbi:MAG: type II toxin-antitoxin system HicA family toxin [Candidatus Nitricoxidivorans perseverans]|uniref:Type II toxin-antitoxin system HicA family toxin n=1 Tax=Candidatus Nitricoxidivorans perseverans TaxID=2975601 RepID=A0AA49FND9_9PROT|nr:MAG: type II toxin-antitoxin system HicA family toxin [Candidatus Nitricoxidivorans perseverans]
MKRRDLIRLLEQMGCVLVRNGGRHDWYTNPDTRQSQPVPRHNEINEHLARSIIRKLEKGNA